MERVYAVTGAVAFWSMALAVSAFVLYVAVEYVCGAIRLCRVLRHNLMEGVDPWPQLSGFWPKLRAFFLMTHYLVTDRYDAVYDNGDLVPRYPWQKRKPRDD